MNLLAESSKDKIFVQAVNYCQNIALIVRSVGITATQTYDRINNVFVPDYTDDACWLQIFPQCTLMNPDSPVASIAVNANLTSITWEEVTPSGTSKIYPLASTKKFKDGYEVTESGDSKGEIFVKSNGIVGVKRTLRFKAQWVDVQSGFVYNFQKDIGLDVKNATEPLPELVVSAPKTLLWNPFRNVSTYDVSASVFVGNTDMAADARCKLWWYRLMEDGSKQLIAGGDTPNDLDTISVKKGANGQIIGVSFNLDMMGDGNSYEVRAAFRSSGRLPSEAEKGDPIYQFTIARRFPRLSASICGGKISVVDGTPSVLLTAVIKDNMDLIPNWNEHACAYWYRVKTWIDSNSNMQESKTLIGTGESIIVPTTEQNFIHLSLVDRGSMCVLTDDDGNYLVDANGAYLVDREITI